MIDEPPPAKPTRPRRTVAKPPRRGWRRLLWILAAILILAQLCADEGLFTAIGTFTARAARGSPTRLLTMVFVVTAMITAILSLDATVVLLTPVVFATAASVGLRAKPHVYACTHLANSGSLLLPVSNLTNLLAFTASGLSFGAFTLLMALPWVVAVCVEYVIFRFFFRPVPSAVAREMAWSQMGSGALLPGGGVGSLAAGGWLLHLAGMSTRQILQRSSGLFFLTSAINVITRNPSGEFKVTQEITGGNYDQFRTRTSVDLPAWGPLSAYVTFVHNERRGDIRNLGAGTAQDEHAAGRNHLHQHPERPGCPGSGQLAHVSMVPHATGCALQRGRPDGLGHCRRGFPLEQDRVVVDVRNHLRPQLGYALVPGRHDLGRQQRRRLAE